MYQAAGMPRYSFVKRAHIAAIDRNLAAIEVTAKMLANNAYESDCPVCVPLDPWTTVCLMGGVESLRSFSRMLTERLLEEACEDVDGQ